MLTPNIHTSTFTIISQTSHTHTQKPIRSMKVKRTWKILKSPSPYIQHARVTIINNLSCYILIHKIKHFTHITRNGRNRGISKTSDNFNHTQRLSIITIHQLYGSHSYKTWNNIHQYQNRIWSKQRRDE